MMHRRQPGVYTCDLRAVIPDDDKDASSGWPRHFGVIQLPLFGKQHAHEQERGFDVTECVLDAIWFDRYTTRPGRSFVQ